MAPETFEQCVAYMILLVILHTFLFLPESLFVKRYLLPSQTSDGFSDALNMSCASMGYKCRLWNLYMGCGLLLLYDKRRGAKVGCIQS